MLTINKNIIKNIGDILNNLDANFKIVWNYHEFAF